MVSSLLLATVLMGCGGTPMASQLPVNRTRAFSQAIDTLGPAFEIAADAERVMALLPEVYQELGLEVNFREPGRIGTCYQQLRRRLGKAPLSWFVDCGETRSLPNADHFDVMLTVLTSVLPAEHGSTIRVFLLAVGQDPTTSGGRVWCFSKAELEDRIAKRLKATIAEG